jgi:hypothetical protein
MRRGLGSLSALDMPAGMIGTQRTRVGRQKRPANGRPLRMTPEVTSRRSLRAIAAGTILGFVTFSVPVADLARACRSAQSTAPHFSGGEIGAVPQNALTVTDRPCVRQVTTIRAPSFPWLLLRPVASKACCAVANLSSRHTRRAAAVRAQGFSHGGNYPLWSPLFWINYLDPQLALLAVQFCSPKHSIFRTRYGQPHLWS